MKLINNEINLNNRYIGKILSFNTDTRECYVHIPQIMTTLNSNSVFNNTVPISRNNIKNAENLNLNTNISKTNKFKVKAYDVRDKMPKVGSKVWVRFIDGNIQHGYWSEFNVDNSLEYIDEEKYSKMYSLNIGNKFIEVKEEDVINIELPDEYEVLYTEDVKTKTKTFKIITQEDYSAKTLLEQIEKINTTLSELGTGYKVGIINDLKLIQGETSLYLSYISEKVEEGITDAITEITKISDIASVSKFYNLITNKMNVGISVDDMFRELEYLYKSNESLELPLVKNISLIGAELVALIGEVFDSENFINIAQSQLSLNELLSKSKTTSFVNPGNNFDVIATYTDNIFTPVLFPTKEEVYANTFEVSLEEANESSSSMGFFGFFFDEKYDIIVKDQYIQGNHTLIAGYVTLDLGLTTNSDGDSTPTKLFVKPMLMSPITDYEISNIVISMNGIKENLTELSTVHTLEITESTFNDIMNGNEVSVSLSFTVSKLGVSDTVYTEVKLEK